MYYIFGAIIQSPEQSSHHWGRNTILDYIQVWKVGASQTGHNHLKRYDKRGKKNYGLGVAISTSIKYYIIFYSGMGWQRSCL